jgi:chloramphenicol 3-O-phosphotransferase
MPMKLLYLHGPPASGKLTVAQAVVHLTQGRLLDNHAAIDFGRTVLEFDGPGFWDLVHSARMLALEKAAEHGVPLVVQTSCYAHPEDLPLLEDFERVLARHGGTLLPVFLACSRRTLEERVGAADRVRRRKVSTKEGLDSSLSRWNMVPVPRPNCYTVDTDAATPSEAAREIVAHFGLDEGATGGA